MKKLRSLIVFALILAIAVFPAQQALAASQTDTTNLSNTYSNKISPIANYNADQVGPHNGYFVDRNEVVDPGSGVLTVMETDLTLPGRNGLDLSLQRLYQNQEANIYRASTRVESYQDSYWVPGHYGSGPVWVPPTETCTDKTTCTPVTTCVPVTNCTPGYWTTRTYTRTVPGHYEEERWIDTGCMCWKSKQVWIPGYTETVTEQVWVPESCTTTQNCTTTQSCTTTRDCKTTAGYWTTGTVWYDGYWQPYTDYRVVNQVATDTFIDGRNAIGVGWQWNLASLEVKGSDIIYHYGSQSLSVDWNSPSRFKDYGTTDIVFDNDAGTFVNGDNVPSKYKVTTKEGTRTFFGSDGRLLGIMDRYANQISFTHTIVSGQPLIRQITDTIGRTVTFTYTAALVTMTGPDGRTWKYGLTQTDAGKMLLTSREDPMGRVTRYTYRNDSAAFSFTSKSNRNTNNLYANLIQIGYPTGASTEFAYSKTVDNLGTDGSRELYKLSSRADKIGTTSINPVTYQYTGEPGGYPTYSNPSSLPTSYTYSSTRTQADGTKVIATTDYRHLTVRSETTGTGFRKVTETTYDSLKQPSQTKATYYNAAGATRSVVTKTTYDSQRRLVSQTEADGAVVTYEFDVFSQLKAVQHVRSDAATLRTEYTVNQSNGNREQMRQVFMDGTTDRSGITKYQYDQFGNVIRSEQLKGTEPSNVRTYEYDPIYGSAYLTREAETYGNGTLTAVQRYEYNRESGWITAYTDPLNARTTVAYDNLGRPTLLTFPEVDGIAATKQFTYDDVNRVTTVTDENSHATQIQYDQLGRLSSVRRTLGSEVRTVSAVQYDALGRLASGTDANGNVTTYTYDGGGRTTSVKYQDGSTVNTAYDDVAHSKTVTDENGNPTVTFFDAMGRIVEVDRKPDKAGTTVYQTKYTYDSAGNQITVTDARNGITRFVYDPLNRLTRTIDAMGNQFDYTYDIAGNRLTESGPGGRLVRYAYDAANRQTSMTNPLGGITSMTYDAKGRKLSQTEPNGSTTSWTYDARDLLVLTTDALGNQTRSTYDKVGNRKTTTDARSGVMAYDYDEWNRLTSLTDAVGSRVKFAYDWNGNQTSVTDPFGKTTSVTYDVRNRPVTQVDALNNTVFTYGYDAVGNRISVKDARLNTATYAYDGLNRLVSVKNALNAETRFEFDGAGNIVRSFDGKGNATSYKYDPLNRLVEVTDGANAKWTYTLDAYGNNTQIIDPLGQVMREDTYDLLSRKTSSKDGVGNVTNYSYDPTGNLVGLQVNGLLPYPLWTLSDDPDKNGVATGWAPSQWTSSGVGTDDTATMTTTIEDEAQKLTISNHTAGADGTLGVYSAAIYRDTPSTRWTVAPGEVYTVSVDFKQDGGGYGQLLVYWYDAAGNRLDGQYGAALTSANSWQRASLTAKPAPANAASMGLFLMFRTTPEAPNGSLSYRLAQVEKGTTAAGPQTFTVDKMSRLTGITAAAGQTTRFTYDGVGNRTGMSDSTGTTTNTYDAANRLVKRTVPDGRSILYGYDLAGRLSQVVDYAGNITDYQYRDDGRVKSATYSDGSAASFAYDAAGNLKQVSLPGGMTSTYDYDAANRLVDLTIRNSAGVMYSYGYAYDQADNLIRKTDKTAAPADTLYEYDPQNRLTKVTSPSGLVTAYGYYTDGNRSALTETQGTTSKTTTYTYDAADRLSQVTTPSGTKSYTWDKFGNQTSDGTNRYEYDNLNRLVSVRAMADNALLASYQFNGDGMMVARTTSTGTTRFYLDRDQVINEAEGSGTFTASMFRAQGELIGRKLASQPTAFYLKDGHRDVTGIADGSGNLIATYQYDAFGNLSGSTGSFDNPYLYAGEYFDRATGQYYLRSRFYSPFLGRFLSMDTFLGSLSRPASLNLYAYVEQNPMNMVDPTGHAGKYLHDIGTGDPAPPPSTPKEPTQEQSQQPNPNGTGSGAVGQEQAGQSGSGALGQQPAGQTGSGALGQQQPGQTGSGALGQQQPQQEQKPAEPKKDADGGYWSTYAADWDYSPEMRAKYEKALNDLPANPSREEFLKAMIPLARWWQVNGITQGSITLHVPWQVTVIQAVHESDWGTARPYGKPVNTAWFNYKYTVDKNGELESWNLFGMTAPQSLEWASVWCKTGEMKKDGTTYETVREFRAYPNRAASVAHYQYNLTFFPEIQKYIGAVKDKESIIDLLAYIGRYYATDLEYGNKTRKLYGEIFK